MPSTPCVKGSIYASVHEDVNKLLASGQLTREEAARHLDASDFEQLEQEVNIASWYDITSYDRLCRLLHEVEGEGTTEYLIERGRATARRLRESGLYGQVEYLDRAQALQTDTPEARFAALGRDIRRTNTLSASLFNFTTWSVEADPHARSRNCILVRDSAALPDTLLWRIQGFMNEMARPHAGDRLWVWRRESRDLVVYSMRRDV